MRIETETQPETVDSRQRPEPPVAEPQARRPWPAWLWLGLAPLVGLTCLAVASLSAWLVVPYLGLMAWLLLAPGGRGRAETVASPESAAVPVGSEPTDASDGGVATETGADLSATPPPTKGRRGRGSKSKRSREKEPEPVESPAVTWVCVGPGKFVRVEGPSPVAGPIEVPPVVEAVDGTPANRAGEVAPEFPSVPDAEPGDEPDDSAPDTADPPFPDEPISPEPEATVDAVALPVSEPIGGLSDPEDRPAPRFLVAGSACWIVEGMHLLRLEEPGGRRGSWPARLGLDAAAEHVSDLAPDEGAAESTVPECQDFEDHRSEPFAPSVDCDPEVPVPPFCDGAITEDEPAHEGDADAETEFAPPGAEWEDQGGDEGIATVGADAEATDGASTAGGTEGLDPALAAQPPEFGDEFPTPAAPGTARDVAEAAPIVATALAGADDGPGLAPRGWVWARLSAVRGQAVRRRTVVRPRRPNRRRVARVAGRGRRINRHARPRAPPRRVGRVERN